MTLYLFSFCGAFWCRRTAVFPPCTICWTLTWRLRLFAGWTAQREGSAAVFLKNHQRTSFVPLREKEGGVFWGCDTALCWWRLPSGDIWTAYVTQFTEYQMFKSPVVWIGEMFPPSAWHQWSVAPDAAGGRAARCHLLIGLETIKRIIMSRRGPTSR